MEMTSELESQPVKKAKKKSVKSAKTPVMAEKPLKKVQIVEEKKKIKKKSKADEPKVIPCIRYLLLVSHSDVVRGRKRCRNRRLTFDPRRCRRIKE